MKIRARSAAKRGDDPRRVTVRYRTETPTLESGKMETAIRTWRDCRTLGELRQALVEAEDLLATLPGVTDPWTVYTDHVYTDHDGSDDAATVTLVSVTMTDGSTAYNLRLET